jgi:hypothetical protein
VSNGIDVPSSIDVRGPAGNDMASLVLPPLTRVSA